jgi:3-oxoadipate enol-lactonase
MAHQQRHVELDEGALEVTLGDSAAPSLPIICAAHPAGAFGDAVVNLLGETAGARVVCVNPRGIGTSSEPVSPTYTLDDMIDDIEAVRRRLDLGRWVFWGMSGGGWLGQVYARKYPDALAGVVLESVCCCFRLRLADPRCVLSPFHESWQPTLAKQGLVAPDSHAEVGDPAATEWLDVEGVGPVFRRAEGPALLVSPMPLSPEMRRAMPVLWSVDARPWLPAVRTPALVICGRQDPVVPLAHGVAVHDAIPGSELLVVEGGGHVPTTERRPEVAVAVQRFLRERLHPTLS